MQWKRGWKFLENDAAIRAFFTSVLMIFFKTCSLAFTAKNVSIRKICLGLPEGFRVIDACIKTGVRNARTVLSNKCKYSNFKCIMTTCSLTLYIMHTVYEKKQFLLQSVCLGRKNQIVHLAIQLLRDCTIIIRRGA